MDRLSSFRWRPQTTVVLLGGFTLVLVGLVIAYILSNFNIKPTTEVQLGTGTFHLALADTEAAREQGLSGVERLNPDGGLLMQFDTDHQWGIWMKDMKIPLDIVWLDKNKKVVYIKERVNPDLGTSVTMQPKAPSRYVIELSSGSVATAGIHLGQQAKFTLQGDTEQ